MTLYLISGLGADRRVFKRMTFPSDCKVIYIEWLPVTENETLAEYSLKLSTQVNATEKFAIIGLSFGGIVAIELSRLLHSEKVILISSVSTRQEIPSLYRAFGSFRVHRLIPSIFLKKANFIVYYLFGLKTEEEKRLLREIIYDSDIDFLKWAIDVLLTWSNRTRPGNLVHIHGTDDKLLPISGINADKRVEGGGHLMVYSHADEISKILTEVLGFSQHRI